MVTRRLFLSSATTSAAAVAFSPQCLWGTEKERPELSFIVVTDTHLGYKGHEQAARNWASTAAAIEKCSGDLVLHLGDVVDGGREEQYPLYLEHRQQIKKPVHEIPGNHDPPDLFAKYLRQTIDVAVDLKWLRCLLLNNSRTDSHDGFLTGEQLTWVDEQCRDAARRDLFVLPCMHVPAHANQHPDRGWYIKPEHGQRELYALLEKHRDRVLALFHGHFHNGLRGWNDHGPLHEVCFPSALYNLDRKLEEQRAPGYNPLEFRPGFTLVTIRDGAIHLRYVPLEEKGGVEKELPLRPVK